ncbi:MAG: hypothetical protein IJK73_03120 [Bacteroidales bacterium]|nr:hypothetical protein [Bacteroidales bacterium]
MRTLLAAILLLSIAIALMCVGIIVKGRFPETEISRNKDMKRLGIKCMKEEDEQMHFNGSLNRRPSTCDGTWKEECAGCGFYNSHKS